MKRYILLFFISGFFVGCSNDSRRVNNPYLPNYGFSYTINLALPQYSGINSNLNPVAITEPSGNDIIIMKVAGSDFRAWNANCPNQYPTGCSRLSIDHLNAKCNCEDAYIYSLFTGVGNNGAQYTLIPYRVEVIDASTIRIYN